SRECALGIANTAYRLRAASWPSTKMTQFPVEVTWQRRALHVDFQHLVEYRRRELDTADPQPVQNLRRDSGAPEPALHLARIGNPGAVENEKVLQLHAIVLHSQHFGDAHDLTRTVLKARHLHHHF